MALMAIRPDWYASEDATARLHELLGVSGGRRQIPFMAGGTRVMGEYTADGTSVVHVIRELPLALAPCWDELPIDRMYIIERHSPVTEALDGGYDEPMLGNDDLRILARVSTMVNDAGVMRQEIRVELWIDGHKARPLDALLRMITIWYDELRAGHKTPRVPVRIPNQPEAARLHEVIAAADAPHQ